MAGEVPDPEIRAGHERATGEQQLAGSAAGGLAVAGSRGLAEGLVEGCDEPGTAAYDLKRAAENRDLSDAARDYYDGYDRYSVLMYNRPNLPFYRYFQRVDYRTDCEAARETLTQTEESIQIAEARAVMRVKEDFPDNKFELYAVSGNAGIFNAGERAAAYELRAHKLKTWEEVLNGHSDSTMQALQNAFPDIELTPRDLLDIEEKALLREREAERRRTRANTFFHTPEDVKRIAQADNDPEIVAERARLEGNVRQATDELDLFEGSVSHRIFVEPFLQDAAAARLILHHVREGQVTEPTTEVPDQTRPLAETSDE